MHNSIQDHFLPLLTIFCFSLLFISLTCLTKSAHASEPLLIPMEDFFKNPETASFSISPDGKKLAYTKPWNRRLNVFVRDIDSQKETQLTSATERDIAGFFWKGSDRIAYMQDTGGDENFHVYIVDISGGKPRELTPFPGVKTYVQDDLEEDPKHMLISMNKNNPEVFDVYRCDINTGDLSLIAENPGNITGWMTDHAGQLRVAYETDGVNQSLLYRSEEGQPFQKLLTTSFKDTFSPLFFSYDRIIDICLVYFILI